VRVRVACGGKGVEGACGCLGRVAGGRFAT